MIPSDTAARHEDHGPSESTPLLSETTANGYSGSRPASTAPPHRSSKKPGWSASLTALLLLSLLMVLIMLFGFFVPDVMEQYAVQAATFSIDGVEPELTPDGARARVRGTFGMRSANVKSAHVRNLGVLGTWVTRQVQTGEAKVEVRLPDYDNVLLGNAVVPPLKVSIVDGQNTDFDFETELIPPNSIEALRAVADDWVFNRLRHLRVAGAAKVKLRSGILILPPTLIQQTIDIEESRIPALPRFNVTKLNFEEGRLPDDTKGVAANASIVVQNDFPLDFTVPPLNFEVMVENCLPSEPKIIFADASVGSVQIHAKTDVQVNASGFIREPSESLTDACPHSGKSPLDTLLGGYMRGHQITIYVTGSEAQSPTTPAWITTLLTSVTVPVPITGHALGNVIKNFTFADVRFTLPDPGADPRTPDSEPKVSATITAVITLPDEMNFSVDVQRVRATSDVFYHKRKMGELNIRHWQPAKSTPLGKEDGKPLLLVESDVKDAPLTITDDDVFADVLQALLFRQKVTLNVKAKVDVEIDTALGALTVQEIPAEGEVPVKPIPSGGLGSLEPKARDIAVVKTTKNSIILEAVMDLRNPTNYSAHVPYVDINFLVNDTGLGHVTARNIDVTAGLNVGIRVQAEWAPVGEKDRLVGNELLSQFISGCNITLSAKTHRGSIPSHPALGEALSRLNISIPIPHLAFPGNPDSPDDDEEDDPDDSFNHPRFLQGATLHLLTSRATFTLRNPLLAAPGLSSPFLTVSRLNATALYHGDEVGRIADAPPFEVPAGLADTPKLPVEWRLGGIGYGAVRRALGGTLRLHGVAEAVVAVGDWSGRLWLRGAGIGAHVRL